MSEQESGQVSEEEKKAIEILETLSCYGLSLKITDENIQAIDIVLDYIDKLQKENKELKEDNSHQWKERCRLTFELGKLQKENEELKEKYENINWYFENQKGNFVHKNKIENKIKEYENMLKTLNKKSDIDRIKAINERIIGYKELLGVADNE